MVGTRNYKTLKKKRISCQQILSFFGFSRLCQSYSIPERREMMKSKLNYEEKTKGEFNCVIHLNRLAGGVDLDDSLMMGKVETELAGVGCGALVTVDQFVTILARTFETAFHVVARLIAETPFLALVPICTKRNPRKKHKEFRQYFHN